ncbi:MAG TPA: hypothetical protein VFS34_13190, partial [Thermoanaerobaculia bacterium]|nr:hypothetical protein [Thermoanaerobaculia bacterium]
GAAAAAVREARWRALAQRELAGEVVLGTIRPEDLEALVSGRRFRRDWLPGTSERRVFRRFARRLARAKRAQARAASTRRKLLQVQILTLRTRLRGAVSTLAAREGLD